jgi:hypothetical protein
MTTDPPAGLSPVSGRTPFDRLDVVWHDPDLTRLADRLRRFGLEASPAGTIELDGGTVRLERGTGPSRLSLVDRPGRPDAWRAPVGEPPAAAPRPVGAAGRPRLLAVGIATVDAERYRADRPHLELTDAPDDELLGARAMITSGSHPGIVILEPSTEGRLAASLARFGEGPAVLYVESEVPPADGRIASGPLGRAWLLAGGHIAGPHLLIVEAGGTITP